MTRSRRPTIRDVAAAARVSPTTVSHALSGLGKISETTRAHVREVAAEIGYAPNPRATALRLGTSRTLAVASAMSPSVTGGPAKLGFFMEVAASGAEQALEHGYALLLVPLTDGDPTAGLRRVAPDGLLAVEPAADDPLVDFARCAELPFVTLGEFPGQRPREHAVALPSVEVADQLVQHVAHGGARAPLLLVGDRDRVSYRALSERYEREAAARGWTPRIQRLDERDAQSAAHAAALAWLEEDPEVDAVIASVDAFATGVVDALASRGRRVPDDVVVVTRYDGVRARTCRPPLTAVDLGLGPLAASAVDTLIAVIEGRTPPAPAEASARLVVRESSHGVEDDHGARHEREHEDAQA